MAFNASEIFSYHQLRKKAEREIIRLECAELTMDEDVLDHALNAAFSIFHLLEWREKTTKPNTKKSAFELLQNISRESLNILHDIVTLNKHATVSNLQHSNAPKVQISEKELNYLALQNGGKLLLKNGGALLMESSKSVVNFNGKAAVPILRDALWEFEE